MNRGVYYKGGLDDEEKNLSRFGCACSRCRIFRLCSYTSCFGNAIVGAV